MAQTPVRGAERAVVPNAFGCTCDNHSWTLRSRHSLQRGHNNLGQGAMWRRRCFLDPLAPSALARAGNSCLN
eukprot:1839434-Rhodomonas_salina.3